MTKSEDESYGIDYQARKAAILASSSIVELKRTQNMPPVPSCIDEENFVFISYSHMDYKAVYCDLLEFHKNGLRYWYDEGLPAGEDWDKIENNGEVQKLAKELAFAKSFGIKDGVLLHYMGEGGDVDIPKGVIIISNQAFYDCKSLTSIAYDGTMAQWAAIQKGLFWDDESGDYVVHCTDGDIPKSEA